VVARAVLYGAKTEKVFIAKHLDHMAVVRNDEIIICQRRNPNS
jgi:hypothetical protein